MKFKTNTNYIVINLTKYMQGLYEKNYKTLNNKIKGELNNWGDVLCKWIVDILNIMKMAIVFQ